MADLSTSARAKVQIDAGQSLRVESEGGSATVTAIYGAPAGATVVTGSSVFGPYGVPAVLSVLCTSGTASYSVVRDDPAANTLTAAEVARIKVGTVSLLASALPAASSANAGTFYRVTDENGGTLYYSTGVSMIKLAPGLSEYDIASCLWADRGTGVVGQVKRISNLGNNPLVEAVWDGARWAPRGGRQLIYSSRGNIDGASATTSAVTLPAVTIPGGLLGVNFGLDVEVATHTLASAATTANTISYTFGGFELFGTDRTTSRRIWNGRRLRNMDAANVQTVMSNASGMGGFEAAANDPKETTKNTTADVAMAGTATAVAGSALVNRCDEFKIWWVGA